MINLIIGKENKEREEKKNKNQGIILWNVEGKKTFTIYFVIYVFSLFRKTFFFLTPCCTDTAGFELKIKI